jgi:hypothetical protein
MFNHKSSGELVRISDKVRFFWTKVRAEPSQNSLPTFLDILLIMLPLLAALAIVVIVYQTRSSQIQEDRKKFMSLREQEGTLQQELSNIAAATALSDAELATPHPTIQDRDFQVIGEHANVSWTFKPDDTRDPAARTSIAYMIEVVKVRVKTIGGGVGDCDAATDFFGCKLGVGKRFMATDDKLHTSRVPPDEHTLAPAIYAWRVRAVPYGTIVIEKSESGDGVDDSASLSNWSAYGSFTVYKSILDRIADTHHVRVGTNLEQNTQFGRRDPQGLPTGFDVSLIFGLIEGCMQLDGNKLASNPACQSYLDNQLSYLRDQLILLIPESKKHKQPPPNCKPDGTLTDPKSPNLCVEFVPVRKWNAWQDALRRKDIDIMVGGVTAAAAREGSGLRFTRGYLKYQSRLYVHSGDASTIGEWIARSRKVGVIEASSNQILLNEIKLLHDPEKGSPCRICPMTYSSSPGLEAAMDRGELDGVLLDDTFVESHAGWKPLDISGEEVAWQNYVKHFLGYRGREEIAVAVAVDGLAEPEGSASLFSKLDEELDSHGPAGPYLPKLCELFWRPGNSSSYKCGELK